MHLAEFVESLEKRQMLAVQILNPVADINVLTNAPAQTIDLTGRYKDTNSQGTVVDMKFNIGAARVALTDVTTPKTVANFMAYVNAGRYNNTFIHRSVPGFIEQGGGYSLTSTGPVHVTTYSPVVNEYQAGVTSNIRGTIAMAKLGGDPNSATSEWFFNLADNSSNLNNQNGGFTTFGKVIGGMTTVIDKMAAIPIYNAGSPFDTLPLQNYVSGSITSANLITLNSVTKLPIYGTTPGASVYAFSLTNSNPSLVTAGVSSTALKLTYAAGKTGSASIGIKVTALDGSSITDTFVVNVYTPAGVSGNVFKDLNGNGIKDTTDTNLAGWKAFIDANKNGLWDSTEKNVLTDASGNFSLSSLLPGSYRMRVVAASGFASSNPSVGYFDIVLTAGQLLSGKNFAFAATGKISGNIYNDLSGNGVKETTDTNLAGWKVYIDSNKNNLWDSTEKYALTDSSGNYTLPRLEAGSFRLRVVKSIGFRVTNPSADYYDVSIAAGQVVSGKNFGYTTRVLISGSVFNDANGSKLKDSAETGLSGWRVFVDANKDGIWQSTEKSVLSDASGNWSFTDLAAGSYVIGLVQQTGWNRTTPTSNFAVTLASGAIATGLSFGEKK